MKINQIAIVPYWRVLIISLQLFFFLESSLKIVAMGFKAFWMSGWNKFDFFVVSASIGDILMGFIFKGGGASFLRIGPQLARVVRVLRVSRLLKLVKSF